MIIVEGIFDVLNMRDKGCYNVITGFGTSSLFKTFESKLAHYKILGVNKFYILFDGDSAGVKAGKKLEELMTEKGWNAQHIDILEDGEDPGSLSEAEIQFIMKEIYGNESSNS